MKTVFAIVALLLVHCIALNAQQQNNIIPQPEKIKWGTGNFTFTPCTRLVYDTSNKALQFAVAPLVSKLVTAASINLQNQCKNAPVVTIQLSKTIDKEEGYELTIKPKQITIVAQQPAGAFYAVQTLLQLLPYHIESPQTFSAVKWQAPSVEIRDAPRFSYRGIMLDVSRHLMPVDSIKRIIDLIAMQKMNRFHWHLTDNDGWRFESKKYPRLTQVGAYRKGSPIGNNITYNFEKLPNEATYGGYYTQEQMKEVVQYAAERFVTVVPEIEMPAHAMAAIASYPELSCRDSLGKPFPYPEQIQGEFCTSDATFDFLTGILSEVMTIFPSRYIHIGGDEAEKENWKTCPVCQKRMQDQGLRNVHELQSYFIKRIEQFVNSKERSIIGWDEIMQGGVAPNAAVMSWTGTKNGIEAARKKHEVVMSPLPFCYFDHAQSDAPGEPAAYSGLIQLSDVYSFDPVPPALQTATSGFIKGAQGNLWTEYVPNAAHAEYMLFPRAIALAEVTWSQPGLKDFPDFTRRLLRYYPRLDLKKVNYSRHLYDIRVSDLQKAGNKFLATLNGAHNGHKIVYTLDGTSPTEQSATYLRPILITQSCTLKAAIYRDGRIIDQTEKVYSLHKGVGRKSHLAIPPDYLKGKINGWHNGSLCDDERINDFRFEDEIRYNDDTWLGWNDKRFEGILDFEQPTNFQQVRARFFHNIPFGIMVPKAVTVLTSNDGIQFTAARSASVGRPKANGTLTVEIPLNGISARYLKVIAEPWGQTPAGNNAWLYVDEIIVE